MPKPNPGRRGRRAKPTTIKTSRPRSEEISSTRRRALEDPGRSLELARGAYSISGLISGLIAAGIAFLTDYFLEPPLTGQPTTTLPTGQNSGDQVVHPFRVAPTVQAEQPRITEKSSLQGISRPISPVSWTTQPGSQKRRRWTFHRRLFRRAETASSTAKVYKKNCGIGKKVWSDAASTGEMSGTDTGKNVSGNRSGNWTQKMGNP